MRSSTFKVPNTGCGQKRPEHLVFSRVSSIQRSHSTYSDAPYIFKVPDAEIEKKKLDNQKIICSRTSTARSYLCNSFVATTIQSQVPVWRYPSLILDRKSLQSKTSSIKSMSFEKDVTAGKWRVRSGPEFICGYSRRKSHSTSVDSCTDL